MPPFGPESPRRRVRRNAPQGESPRWSRGWVAVAAVGLVLVSERPTLAYIDPGSGSLIYQAALAVFLGLGFTLRRATAAVFRFMRGRFVDRGSTAAPGRPDEL